MNSTPSDEYHLTLHLPSNLPLNLPWTRAPRVSGGHVARAALCAIALEPKRVWWVNACRSGGVILLYGTSVSSYAKGISLCQGCWENWMKSYMFKYQVHGGDLVNDDHRAFRGNWSSESDVPKVTQLRVVKLGWKHRVVWVPWDIHSTQLLSPPLILPLPTTTPHCKWKWHKGWLQ